jgi:hypothetical protein
MSLYDKATLVQIPSGYKAADAKLYSVLPNNGNGDFTISADADATRVNKDGFIESTVANQARLSRNFIDGVVQPDPFLLLEPTRTNSITYSEDFSDGSWNKNNATVTVNNTTAPDGSSSADLITSTGTAPYARATFTHSTSTDYCVSIFGKKGDDDYLYIRALALSSQPIASFNLSTGSLGTVNSGLTAEMQNYGNGWYRCIIKYTTTGSITNDLIDFGFASSDNSRFSSSGKFTYFWGAQIETGSYATSLIPTSGSAVTRTIDYASGAGDVNTFNDSEGTLFIDAAALGNDGTYRIINISDGTTSNRVLIQLGNNNNQIRADLVSGGVTQASLSTTSYTFTNFNKIAFKYKGNDTALFINGTQVGTTQTGKTMPTGLDRIDFTNGDLGSTFYFTGKLKQLMYFDTALSNSELIQLTSYDSFGQMAKALLYTIE